MADPQSSRTPSSTNTRAPSVDQHRPPVPSIPPAHQPEPESRRRESHPEKDSAQPLASVPPPQTGFDTKKVPIAETATPLQTTGTHSDPSPENGRQSITPTGRRPSDNMVSNLDKPLPSIDPSQISPIPSFRDPNRSAPAHATLHRRQPAESNDERHSPDYVLRASPGPPASSTFSADVVGIFASIGQSDPSKELGLAPDSLCTRNRSFDVPAPSKNRFPVDLGRSASIDSPARQAGTEPVLSIPVAPRTSSLPINGSLQPASEEVPVSSRSRRLSSPSPSPRNLPAEDLTLKPSSSKVDYAFGGFHSGLGHDDQSGRSGRVSQDRGSQQLVNSDFGPKNELLDDTIRGPKSSDTAVTQTPSVRLVSAPRVGKESRSSEPPTLGEPVGQTSPTGRKTPGDDGRPDSAQPPSADDEDDDEEKGRRMACEFLDSDYSSVPLEKVAEFLGGP
jgi:PH/SEC7 domain-containing protein